MSAVGHWFGEGSMREDWLQSLVPGMCDDLPTYLFVHGCIARRRRRYKRSPRNVDIPFLYQESAGAGVLSESACRVRSRASKWSAATT